MSTIQIAKNRQDAEIAGGGGDQIYYDLFNLLDVFFLQTISISIHNCK